MQRVIEALEYAVDMKDGTLEVERKRLNNLGKEKNDLHKRIEALKESEKCINACIQSAVSSEVARTQTVALQIIINERLDAQEKLRSIITLISECGTLISDLRMDIDEIKSFLKNYAQIEKGYVSRVKVVRH